MLSAYVVARKIAMQMILLFPLSGTPLLPDFQTGGAPKGAPPVFYADSVEAAFTGGKQPPDAAQQRSVGRCGQLGVLRQQGAGRGLGFVQ